MVIWLKSGSPETPRFKLEPDENAGSPVKLMSPTLTVEADPMEVPQESVDGVETDGVDTSMTEGGADDERTP